MLSLQTTKWRRDVTHACHCEPVRAWQSSLLTFLSLRGRSRRELTQQSSLMRHVGCPGDAEVAGWFRWIAASLALLAMTNWAKWDATTGLPRRGLPPPRNNMKENRRKTSKVNARKTGVGDLIRVV